MWLAAFGFVPQPNLRGIPDQSDLVTPLCGVTHLSALCAASPLAPGRGAAIGKPGVSPRRAERRRRFRHLGRWHDGGSPFGHPPYGPSPFPKRMRQVP